MKNTAHKGTVFSLLVICCLLFASSYNMLAHLYGAVLQTTFQPTTVAGERTLDAGTTPGVGSAFPEGYPLHLRGIKFPRRPLMN